MLNFSRLCHGTSCSFHLELLKYMIRTPASMEEVWVCWDQHIVRLSTNRSHRKRTRCLVSSRLLHSSISHARLWVRMLSWILTQPGLQISPLWAAIWLQWYREHKVRNPLMTPLKSQRLDFMLFKHNFWIFYAIEYNQHVR
jgi:hypothetical protein